MSERVREDAGGGWMEFQLGGPLPALEVFAEFMDELGAGGAVFSEDPRGEPGDQMVTVFLALDKAAPATVSQIQSRVESLKQGFDGPWRDLKIIRVENREWTEEWKRGLKPERLEPGLWIVPSFLETPKEAQAEPVIRMDPGMAFGTGLHPTTRMCVRLVCDKVRAGASSVMDLGTGTGILAMAAALFGAKRVLALEIDPIALKVAKDNLETNGLADKVELKRGVEDPDDNLDCPRFELVAANLFAESLVRMLPFVKRCLAESGAAVLAGILHDRAGMVEEAASGSEMIIEQRIEEQGWVTLLLRRVSAG
jgi:ribosomal protein L11 methyltransferase